MTTLKTLLDKPGKWIANGGPEVDVVLSTRATLTRNLADLPFPARCSEDEKRSVLDRIVQALDTSGLLATGSYLALTSLHVREVRMLIERHLITRQLIESRGPRGVYISNDQSVSIMVNERDHIRMCAEVGGLQPQEVLEKLSNIDDALGIPLEYAFHEKRGYLTSSLDEVGTGLKLTASLHTPVLAMNNRMMDLEQNARAEHHMLEGMFNGIIDAPGQLFTLTNRGTLGRSEAEIAFHLRTLAISIVQQERAARAALLSDNPAAVADRVGRALGVARGAHLLDFNEGLALLSSLRLGIATGHLEGYSYPYLDEVMVTSQPAHLECKVGTTCDDCALNLHRAELFRNQFA